ncbi:DUF2254 family protein [Glaciibacter psychrotolerans]|uniref:Putative membrane protein n=1 Tax=Glaciibacter psychrotolerans TaxID=670054 RepID=A0A7Z0J4R9_9MICO|nr:putative membrane protein [Leifsonia psychrotolerans]
MLTHSVARDAFRAQLWPIPVTGVVLAVVAGLFLPHLDAGVDGNLPGWLDAVVFSGDPDASRTVLDAVASSLITVTALTFSLTVVTLQLASSQFSPRLLRTFTQDLFVQATLALFLATFTYSLTVLRSVRSSVDGGTAAFVPRIAVTVSFLLALASVIVLVLFLAHLTRQIRVETMLHNVHLDASRTIAANLIRRSDDSVAPPPTPAQSTRVFATESGFLLRVDQRQLVDLADDVDAVIRIDREPGDFLVTGTPLATFWQPGGGCLTEPDVITRVRAGVGEAVHTGPERTAAQDVGHGLRQLTDVVNKALSPGINDPTTAVHALGHISSLLVELTRYQLGPVTLTGAGNVPRVILNRPSFEGHLDASITQPRRYGASDPAVVNSLFRLCEDLAWNSPREHYPVIAHQLERLRASIADESFDDVERSRFAKLHDTVVALLRRP